MEALIFVGILVALVIITLARGIRIVPQGHVYTVERFGRYTRSLKPGLGLVVPFVEGVGHKLNMMETVLDVPSQEVITRDNAMVTVDAVVFYQILDAPKAAYEVNNREAAVINLVMTNIRTVMGSMDLDELLSQRDVINGKLLTVVDEATEPWGIKLTRIEIMDIAPPRDLVDAMARQMKAERDKRAQILEADGERQAAILRAEGLKASTVLEAEGRREAAFRDAEARERAADAEAKATSVVSAAIADGSVQAINYFVATKYVDALRDVAAAPNQKLIMMPLEASGVIGAIGGISELTRDSFAGPRPDGSGGSGGGSGSGSGSGSHEPKPSPSGGGAASGGYATSAHAAPAPSPTHASVPTVMHMANAASTPGSAPLASQQRTEDVVAGMSEGAGSLYQQYANIADQVRRSVREGTGFDLFGGDAETLLRPTPTRSSGPTKPTPWGGSVPPSGEA